MLQPGLYTSFLPSAMHRCVPTKHNSQLITIASPGREKLKITVPKCGRIRQSLPGVQVFMLWLLLYSAGFTGSSSVPVVASSVFGRVYRECKCSCGGFFCIRQGLPGVQVFMWWLLLYSAGFTGSSSVPVVASSVFGRVYREFKCSCGGFFCIRQGLPGVQVFLWWLFCIRQGLLGVQVFLWWRLLYSAGFTGSSSVPVVSSSVFGRVYRECKCSCGGVFCIRQGLPGVQVFLWWRLLYSAGFTGSSSVPVVAPSVFGRVYREFKCSCGGVFCIRQGLPGVQVFLWWLLLYSAGFTGSASVPVVASCVSCEVRSCCLEIVIFLKLQSQPSGWAFFCYENLSFRLG